MLMGVCKLVSSKAINLRKHKKITLGGGKYQLSTERNFLHKLLNLELYYQNVSRSCHLLTANKSCINLNILKFVIQECITI